MSSELPYQSTIRRKVREKKKHGAITANVAGTKYEIGSKLHILLTLQLNYVIRIKKSGWSKDSYIAKKASRSKYDRA